MTPQIGQNEQIFDQNFDFRGHLSTFRAENTPKSRPLMAENNVQTNPKQVQNNFEKVQKTNFEPPKLTKMSREAKFHLFSNDMKFHET